MKEFDRGKETIITEIGQVFSEEKEEYYKPGDQFHVNRVFPDDPAALKYDMESYDRIASPMMNNKILFVEIVRNEKDLRQICGSSSISMENVIGIVDGFTTKIMGIQTFPEEVMSPTAAYFLKTHTKREISNMIANTRMVVKQNAAEYDKLYVEKIVSVVLMDRHKYYAQVQ